MKNYGFELAGLALSIGGIPSSVELVALLSTVSALVCAGVALVKACFQIFKIWRDVLRGKKTASEAIDETADVVEEVTINAPEDRRSSPFD